MALRPHEIEEEHESGMRLEADRCHSLSALVQSSLSVGSFTARPRGTPQFKQDSVTASQDSHHIVYGFSFFSRPERCKQAQAADEKMMIRI